MQFLKSSLLFSTLFTLTACQNHTIDQMSEQVSDLFRPSTSGQAVKIERNAPNRYANTAYKTSKPPRTQSTVQTRTQRINTTECRDADDWYLDGYRVGKSFTTEKQQMFAQRMHYCHLSASQLPSQFKHNWERGFNVGVGSQGSAKPARKPRRKV